MALITHSKITRTALIDMRDNNVVASWAGELSGVVELPGIGPKANLIKGQSFDEYQVVNYEILRDEQEGPRRFQICTEIKRRFLKATNTLREIHIFDWQSDEEISQKIIGKLEGKKLEGETDEILKRNSDIDSKIKEFKALTDQPSMLKFYETEVAN